MVIKNSIANMSSDVKRMLHDISIDDNPPLKVAKLKVNDLEIVLPIIKPESIDIIKENIVVIESSKNRVENKKLQHGYIMKSNDVNNIKGYKEFKENLTASYIKIMTDKQEDGKRSTRSSANVSAHESYGGLETDFFNYGNPWLTDNGERMTDNEFFPMSSDLGKEYVQVSQSQNKYWGKDVDKFVCYFTKHYVHIYDEYKDLIPYSICSMTYTKECSRTAHNDPKAYEAIIGFNFHGTGTLKLLKYTDSYHHKHREQQIHLDDDDCYLMLGYDTCRERKHAVDNCSKNRFVHLIKYVHKDHYVGIVSELIGNNERKKEALEEAVQKIFDNIIRQ
jgi:hypothetical protein